MNPSEFIRAWSPENGRLRLPASGPHTVGRRAALKIRLAGLKVHAAVTGVIRSIWREPGRAGVDLVPDAQGLRATRWLAAAARGEEVPSQERARRKTAQLPVVVAAGDPGTFTTTLNVSEGGCALRWPGEPPRIGGAIRLRLGANARAPEARFIVRWVDPSRPGRVGLELAPDSSSSTAWGRLIGSVGHYPKP
jgi:hypothetical protein